MVEQPHACKNSDVSGLPSGVMKTNRKKVVQEALGSLWPSSKGLLNQQIQLQENEGGVVHVCRRICLASLTLWRPNKRDQNCSYRR